MGQDEASHAGPDELADDRLRSRWRGPLPREGGQAFRSRVESDRQPVAGDIETRAQVRRPIGDGRGQDDARGAGREGQPDAFRRIDAAGQLEGHGRPGRDGADRIEVRRGARDGALEVDEVDKAGTLGDQALHDPLRPVGRGADALRGAGPVDDPRPPGLEVDRRDDLHGLRRPRRPAGVGGS